MNKMFKITGNEQDFPEFRQFHQLSSEFLPFAQKKLGFNKPVDINLVSDPENAKDPLGKTAYYDPNMMKITLFVDKRHVKDILRSLSHELVHHTQNCRGDFRNAVNIGEGNFTTNEALRKLELEAYRDGSGANLRMFEDYKKSMNESNSYLLNDSYLLKEKRQMSNINETKLRKYVTSLIKDILSEGEEVTEEELEEQSKTDRPDRVAGRDTSGRRLDEEDIEEDVVEEECPKCEKCPPCEGPPKEKAKRPPMIREEEPVVEGTEGDKQGKWEIEGTTVTCDPPCTKLEAEKRLKQRKARQSAGKNENWFKGNKDQLLFESLMKKWCK